MHHITHYVHTTYYAKSTFRWQPWACLRKIVFRMTRFVMTNQIIHTNA
jgi:hypothetical protein